MSRLITNPNPGTSSLPFGADTGGEVGVLDVVPAEGTGAAVAVLVWEFSILGGGGAATGGGSAATGGGSAAIGGGSGGAGGGAANGLAGFTGLAMLVGFVALF